MKKLIALILCLALIGAIFCGCETKKQPIMATKPSISLDSDAILYENPDGRSNQVGTIAAAAAIEYLSTQEVDGVTWYEVKDGWFSVFVPSGNIGQAVSYGFAKENIVLLTGAAASAADVGSSVVVGSRVNIFQIRDNWGQAENGWVNLDQLYMPGHSGQNAGWGLTLNTVKCYSEPNHDSNKVSEYRALYRMKIHEIIDINTVSWAYTDSGWVELADVYVEGTKSTGACRGTVTDETALNVRVGPGTGYEIVRSLPIRSSVNVLFQVTINSYNWGFIGDGWVFMDYVKVVE